MKWFRHKAISDDDFDLLRGTATMEKFQHNRLVITLDPNEKRPSNKKMGLYDTKGLVYIRYLSHREDTVEVLFEEPEDLDMLGQYLTQYKIGME